MRDEKILEEIVSKILEKGKGILAADESNSTADKRLASVGVEGGEDNRKRYRDVFLCAKGMEEYVSGVILYDETFWQDNCAGINFAKDLTERGVLPGIKVDTGAEDSEVYPGEKVTEGLEGLRERLEQYADAGAKFTKWRAVIKIDEEKGLPTDGVILENAKRLAEYASLVQEYNMVPIIEPEVLLLGKHDIDKSKEVLGKTLSVVFEQVKEKDVYLPGLILKTSMAIGGNENAEEYSVDEVADATVEVLSKTVPNEVGGVVFLSGGQTPVEATAHLDAIAEREPLNWEIAFSYARALQGPSLRIWAGNDDNLEAAREEFLKRLEMNSLADAGEYDIELEWED